MLQGTHDELSLGDLIQVGAASRRTLRARVHGLRARGEVLLYRGELKHARYGDLVGSEAMYAMLADNRLRYEVEADVPSRSATTVHESVPQILLEAARRIDEGTVRAPTEPPELARRRAGWIALAVAAFVTSVGVGAILALTAAEDVAVAARIDEPATAVIAAEPGEEIVDAADLTGEGDVPPLFREGAPPRVPDVDLVLRPTIVLRLQIDAAGAVIEARVYRSRLELAAFEDAALEAARDFRFEPARRAGRAVPVWINWPVAFGESAAARERIRIKGSDTIGGALGPALAAAFSARRSGVEVAVEGLGSSTAFVGLFDGSADLGASSRSINDKELAEARRLGVSLEEIVIGYDGIAVIVHPDNPIAALTVDQVARVFTGEVTRWNEIGGRDAPITLYSRPDYSGTHGFFRDKVLRRGDSKGAEEFAAATVWIEESRDLAARVAAEADAIGYVGMGWVAPEVRALRLAPGEGAAIAPSPATVRDGTYPVYRPLLVYTRGRPGGVVASFLRFVLSAPGQALVEEHGFIRSDIDPDAVIPSAAEHEEAAADDRSPAARIGFGGGSAKLGRSAGLELDAVARQAMATGESILVIGHADNEGDRGDNDELAARRAEAVARRLRRAGVPASRLVVESAGTSAPVASNQDRAGRHQNRRADVFLVTIPPSCGSSSFPCSPPR